MDSFFTLISRDTGLSVPGASADMTYGHMKSCGSCNKGEEASPNSHVIINILQR